eukprot:2338032-Pyramimonas_sp.AAC.1
MDAKMGIRAPALGSVPESLACMSTCAALCRKWRPRTNPFCSSDASFARCERVMLAAEAMSFTSVFLMLRGRSVLGVRVHSQFPSGSSPLGSMAINAWFRSRGAP